MLARFSVVSPRPIPGALVNHVRSTIAEAPAVPEERPVRIPGLTARTWLFDLEPGSVTRTIEQFRHELRGPATALAIDSAFVLGPLAEHGPAAIVTDVDSTFITTEVIEMLAAHAGLEDEVREVTEAAMRGELDFRESLAARVARLAGTPDTVFEDVLTDITLTDGADRLIAALHDRGGRFGLVSGGFTEVVGVLAERTGVDRYVANGLEVADGKLTGRTAGPVIDGLAKVRAIERWLGEWDLPQHLLLTAGDGANDIPMLAYAGLGVAFMGKPVVVEQTDGAITTGRLDAIGALVGWDIDG